MQVIDLLGLQLRGSCALVVDHAQASRDVWTQRAFEGASLPGFVVWHCARIVDWGVHTVVRGVPEVASSQEWRERMHFDAGHGAGLSREEADGVAHAIPAEEVAAYGRALGEVVSGWLEHVTDEDLMRVPDLRGVNAHHPRYATAAAWEEIAGLEGLPGWQFLARPCVNHIRVHAGEVETLREALRRS